MRTIAQLLFTAAFALSLSCVSDVRPPGVGILDGSAGRTDASKPVADAALDDSSAEAVDIGGTEPVDAGGSTLGKDCVDDRGCVEGEECDRATHKCVKQNPEPDAATPVMDAGQSEEDAGTLPPDAGQPPVDAGQVQPDSGLPAPDAGLPAPDAGQPRPDGGASTPDSGLPGTPEVCDGLDNDHNGVTDDVVGDNGAFDGDRFLNIPGTTFNYTGSYGTVDGEIKAFQFVVTPKTKSKSDVQLNMTGAPEIVLRSSLNPSGRTCTLSLGVQDQGSWDKATFMGKISTVLMCCPDGVTIQNLQDFTQISGAGGGVCDGINIAQVQDLIKSKLLQALGQGVGTCY